VTGLHGNLHRTSADELTFGVLHADAAFSVSLSNAYSTISHSYKLDTRGQAHIQCAALYTTPQGERRVRVLNLALTVADLAGNVFRYADMDAVVSHLSKEGQ
jgi:protein transport protein SEC24